MVQNTGALSAATSTGEIRELIGEILSAAQIKGEERELLEKFIRDELGE